MGLLGFLLSIISSISLRQCQFTRVFWLGFKSGCHVAEPNGWHVTKPNGCHITKPNPIQSLLTSQHLTYVIIWYFCKHFFLLISSSFSFIYHPENSFWESFIIVSLTYNLYILKLNLLEFFWYKNIQLCINELNIQCLQIVDQSTCISIKTG